LFLSARREEISLLKILALAEVASDVNRAACCVHWARIISSPPPRHKNKRAAPAAMDTVTVVTGNTMVSRSRMGGENFQRFKDLLAMSSQLLLL
jgi:hypothetical protein